MDEDFDAPRSSSSSLIVGLVIVAALGAGGYSFVNAMSPSYDPAELMQSGVDTPAEIISAQKTGEEYEGQAVYELELQVRSDEGRGHRAFHKQPFAKTDEPKLTKTTKVRVKLDPNDKRKLWVTDVGVEEPEG